MRCTLRSRIPPVAVGTFRKSQHTDLHILALAAPGSGSGCPKAARRVFQGASGALREQLLGVPKHSEGNFWAFSRLRGCFFGDLRRHSLRGRFFPSSVEACSGIPIVLEAGSGVADMIPPGSTIHLEISEQNMRGPLSTLLTG